MASLAEQNFSLFPQQQQEEYSHFTEATHGPVFTSAPMDMGIPADAFVSYVQRAPSQEQYSTSPSTISFEYTTDPSSTYMMSNAPTSPGMYGDNDYLSSLSTGSASSSAVGSPLSNHGQAGMDWAVQGGLNIQPTIAGDYVDFFAHGLEDVTSYDFTGMATAKSYVGKSLFFHFFSFFLCQSLSFIPSGLD